MENLLEKYVLLSFGPLEKEIRVEILPMIYEIAIQYPHHLIVSDIRGKLQDNIPRMNYLKLQFTNERLEYRTDRKEVYRYYLSNIITDIC